MRSTFAESPVVPEMLFSSNAMSVLSLSNLDCSLSRSPFSDLDCCETKQLSVKNTQSGSSIQTSLATRLLSQRADTFQVVLARISSKQAITC